MLILYDYQSIYAPLFLIMPKSAEFYQESEGSLSIEDLVFLRHVLSAWENWLIIIISSMEKVNYLLA